MDVNSKMGEKKLELWEAKSALAAYTHDPEHYAAARKAEKEYRDHIAAQELVDIRVRALLEVEDRRLIEVAKMKPTRAEL
jgi:hypothetical protein